MLKFSANLSFLFTEKPFAERFAAAAAAGFAGVEYLFPYTDSAEALATWQAAAGVESVLFNLPAGDWAAGERGLACLPGRQAEFRAGVDLALRYALRLGCRRLHCLAGIAPVGFDEAVLRETFIDNVRYAATRFAEHGIGVLIEPINSRIDMPGYWLDTPTKAVALLAEIDRPNLALQLDVYHAQVMGFDPAQLVRAHAAVLGHVQIADYPGRHEPGSGEIDFQDLFAALQAVGYVGWVGCEYRPQGETLAGLGWRSCC